MSPLSSSATGRDTTARGHASTRVQHLASAARDRTFYVSRQPQAELGAIVHLASYLPCAQSRSDGDRYELESAFGV